jgi:hypothetical protein
LIQAEGQAAVVILNGRGTGLGASDVEAGMRIYSRLPRRAHVAAVRVLGDTFDLAWARPTSLGHDRSSYPGRPGVLDRPGLRASNRGPRPEPGLSF